LVAGGEQSEAGKQPGDRSRLRAASPRSFEGALEIDQKHGKERSDHGGLGHFAGVTPTRKPKVPLVGELFAQGLFFSWISFMVSFRGAEAARNVA